MTAARMCGSPSHWESGHGAACRDAHSSMPARQRNWTGMDAIRNGESNGSWDNYWSQDAQA